MNKLNTFQLISEHLLFLRCWEGDTGATHFGLKVLSNEDFCQRNLVLLCPILELNSIGLDYVDVVLADVETESGRNKDSI
jgi:hypothetical protein